jgi:hypothetical protein
LVKTHRQSSACYNYSRYLDVLRSGSAASDDLVMFWLGLRPGWLWPKQWLEVVTRSEDSLTLGDLF